jgi:hypothetical protein
LPGARIRNAISPTCLKRARITGLSLWIALRLGDDLLHRYGDFGQMVECFNQHGDISAVQLAARGRPAHSANAFRHSAEYIPLYFSRGAPLVLMAGKRL